MNIGFIVGHTEQHEILLSFDHGSAELRILLDGTPVLHASPNLAKDPIKRYELCIGQYERHTLAVKVAYGDEPEFQCTPRLSLSIVPLSAQATVPVRRPRSVADALLAAPANTG